MDVAVEEDGADTTPEAEDFSSQELEVSRVDFLEFILHKNSSLLSDNCYPTSWSSDTSCSWLYLPPQPLCAVSQQSWFGFFLLHTICNYTPPPQKIKESMADSAVRQKDAEFMDKLAGVVLKIDVRLMGLMRMGGGVQVAAILLGLPWVRKSPFKWIYRDIRSFLGP